MAANWVSSGAYAKAAAHVLITLGIVWFCYQILRAAERLRVPGFVTDVERIRALLGVRSPADAAAKQLEAIARAQEESVAQAFRLLTELAKANSAALGKADPINIATSAATESLLGKKPSTKA